MDKLKSQSEIMEYVFIVFFLVLIIFAIIFFLTYWQTSQFKLEKSKETENRILFVAEHFMNMPFLVKEKLMFDDSKLTAVTKLMECEDLQKIFGKNWYVTIKVFDGEKKMCRYSNYPDCNYWEFCVENKGKESKSYNFPVNIYRKKENRVDMGVMKVGIYE
ncbi:MAG: hypothetical protein DRP18_03165 [Candidatus Aenigmatarchaeota archaeon]|nr:MAG: hypothetical protein DRP18_03165 [Candidatus Aenigmarchaeota archaeon]